MNDRFVVPVELAFTLKEGDRIVRAVDVRRSVECIVRAEVERALGSKNWRDWGIIGLRERDHAYLATRFPEAAPETYTCPNCGKSFLSKPGPRPGCLVLHPSGVCCHYGEVEVAQRDTQTSPVYTDAERDFLRALAVERDLADLAIGATDATLDHARIRMESVRSRNAVLAAARRVVEEAR